MTRTYLNVVAAAVCVACCVSAPVAQTLGPAAGAIDAYRAAIGLAQTAASPGRIEAAYDAIGPVREALLRAVLESLPEHEFLALRRDLNGLLISRDEAIYVEPDVTFFAKLSAARGDRADRAYFAALRSTYPRSVWPVYVEQQTDVSWCTRFGSQTLVSTYLTWTAFRQQYPRRYAVAAGTHVNDVVGALTESTCACGDRASVERELGEFLRRVNGSAVRTQVERRVAALRSGPSSFRFNCQSG